MPILLFCGDKDELFGRFADFQQLASRLPPESFVALLGLTHNQAIERSDLVLPHVTKFLKQVEAGGGVASTEYRAGERSERASLRIVAF